VEPTDEVSVTVTTLPVLLLPQPFSDSRQMAASQRQRKLNILHTFVPTISPTQSRGAELPLALALLSFTSILRLTSIKAPHRRSPQNVRLTVKRKVVFGSK
jgi:hypothetical protein